MRRHEAFGLHDKEYFFALVDTIEVLNKDVLGDEWTEELGSCWADVSLAMKGIISEAASWVWD